MLNEAVPAVETPGEFPELNFLSVNFLPGADFNLQLYQCLILWSSGVTENGLTPQGKVELYLSNTVCYPGGFAVPASHLFSRRLRCLQLT